MKSPRILLALTLVALLMPVTGSQAAADDPLVEFDGHGWGHGMGMSQWGAFERAQQGQDAEEIVTTYYPTTSMVPTATATTASWYHDDPEPVWVNLLSPSPYTSPASFEIRATGPGLTICQQEPRSEAIWSLVNNGGEHSDYVGLLESRLDALGYDPGPVDGWFDDDTDTAVRAFQAAESLTVDGIVGKNSKAALWPSDSGDRCVIETPLSTTTITVTSDVDGNCQVPGALLGDCIGSVRDLSVGTRVVLPGKLDSGTPVELAHGDLRIRPDLDSGNGAFEGIHVVVELGMEDYIAGIDEVMTWWAGSGANEALKAQAIASRTYGLRLVLSYGELGVAGGSSYPYMDDGFSSTKQDQCWCHLYGNTYSQVYNGYTRETESSGVWADAVAATVDPGSGTGQVLTAPGHGVIWAFYTSSNGGASESHNDYYAYPPPSDFSYLVSVPDSYSLTSDNPNANWTKSFDSAYVASKVGLDELDGVTVTETNESGSAKTVEFHGMVGGEETIVEHTGSWVKNNFTLLSRYFDVEWGTLHDDPSPEPDPEPEPEPEPDYTDIDGSVFYNDILWAVEQGIAFPCNEPDDDQFCPTRPVSREEMAVFMMNALDLPPTSVDYFTDDDDSPYEDAINRMAEADITRGCGGTNFCPDLIVDRGQMAAFLGRAFDLVEGGGLDLFIDDDDSIFENDIDRLGTAGITKGCNPPTNNKFCPYLDVERGAMMAFLHRAIGG